MPVVDSPVDLVVQLVKLLVGLSLDLGLDLVLLVGLARVAVLIGLGEGAF